MGGSMRRIILDVLQRLGARSALGGFWVDERGNLLEDYAEDEGLRQQPIDLSDDAWRDELGSPLSNYMGENEMEMEERHCGTESKERQDAVSAGYLRNTSQRGSA